MRPNEYEEVRARALMAECRQLESAAGIASGCGEYGLANRIWALCSRKRRQALVWRHIVAHEERPDPECTMKCDCDAVCYIRGQPLDNGGTLMSPTTAEEPPC